MTARVRGIVAGAALSGALVLTGCGTSANTAVVVNGTTYSESEVRAAAEQLNENFPQQNGEITPTAVVYQLIISDAVIDGAATAGQPQSAGAARSKFTKGDEPNDVAVRVVQTLDATAVVQAGDPAKVVEELRKVDVSLNPRYGTYDRANVSLAAASPTWIVPTAAASTAPAAP